MEIVAIVILALALIGMTALFIRERFARMDEREAFTTQRKELRAMMATMIQKEAAALDRWSSMYASYKSGWNDAVMAMAEADVAEAEAEAAKVLTKAKAKAKAKAERLTMK